MELIPILSTIILVATIATFILAVAAYILYKIRERRARANRPASNAATVPVTTPTVTSGHTLVAPTPTMLAPPPVAVPATTPTYALPANAPAPAYAAPSYGPPAYDTASSPYDAYGTPAYSTPAYDRSAYGTGDDVYGNDVYGHAARGYAFPEGYGAQGLPPVAIDTNADGRADTVYEPRPTYSDATGTAAAYTPAPDTYASAAPSTGVPAVPPGSLFYELTSQGIQPVAQPATPTFQAYPALPSPPVPVPVAVQPALGPAEVHRERLAAEQARLNAADAARERADAARPTPPNAGGLAWL